MNGRQRKWIIITGAVFLLAIAGYLVLKEKVLKAADFKPDPAKAETPLDLRPALIAKLQQLVKDGSKGLYLLTVDTLRPDVIRSTLDARGVRLQVDSAGYRLLAQAQELPDEVFDLRLAALHIDGINIDDLLHRREISLDGIRITDPVISVHRKPQPYNATRRAAGRRLTLYQRLRQQMDRIRIGEVDIRRGTFISYNAASGIKASTFRNISIVLDGILIDSATQYDNSRFLFAKNALLETRDYSLPTPDSLYELKIGTLSISGTAHEATLRNLVLQPRGGKEGFRRRVKERDERFEVICPQAKLSGIEWWALVNGAGLVAERADLSGVKVDVFLDKSLPRHPSGTKKLFPHERLMKVPFPVSVRQVQLHDASVSYGEFNPRSGQSGTITFTGIAATAGHISNVPADIRAHPQLLFQARALFMGQAVMDCAFRLDLAHYQSGAFSVDLDMGPMDHTIANRFSPALSLIEFPSGHMDAARVRLQGDHNRVKGTMAVCYTDLHITPLKEKGGGELKKKRLTGLLANVILIKNRNEEKDLRRPDIDYRPPQPKNFFNLIWTAIRTGLLKTIGVPLSIGMKGDQA